jgi:DNA polymerase III sliding clamp (beta) subunit (PCNA family)
MPEANTEIEIDEETGEIKDIKPSVTFKLEGKTVLGIAPGELKAALRKMVPFMSEEETRHYLCGIYMAYSDCKLTLCATNGHILCEIVKELEAAEDGEFSLIIPAKAVKHLIAVMPKTKDVPYILIKISEDCKEVEIDSEVFRYNFKAIDGTYPDYKKVIPDGKVKMREGMKAGYLVDVLKALGDHPVDISVDNIKDSSNSAHLLTSEEAHGIRCVIMPMRVEQGAEDEAINSFE